MALMLGPDPRTGEESRVVAAPDRLGQRARALLRPLKELRARAGCVDGLDFLWLEITRSCNLTCRHCYAGSAPGLPVFGAMTFGDWCRAMDEARSLGCRRLQFIGGEPTVHPDLGRLIEHAVGNGFRYCEVFTNATRLGDELLDLFARRRVRVAISFYSADPATHDRITGQPGSFEDTVDGIRRLVKRRIRLRAGVIRMAENAGHGRDAAKLLRRLGVRAIGSDRVRGIGRGRRLLPESRPRTELCGDCWRRKLAIDPDGVVYPCVFARFVPLGGFLAGGIEAIVRGAELRTFRRATFFGDSGGAR